MISLGDFIEAGASKRARDFNGCAFDQQIDDWSLSDLSEDELKDWHKKGKIPLEVMTYLWWLGIRVTREEPWTPMLLKTFIPMLRDAIPGFNGHVRLMAESMYAAFVRGEMM